jgi:iron(III) transport system substrate-binding protein
LIFSIFVFAGCSNSDVDEKGAVIVYTSVDQVFSSKILKQFENDTGITVKALYDTEASKAVGLEKRLLAERGHPKADVFWNSEFMRTVRLEHAGVFEKHMKDTSDYISDKYYSPEGLWYGMGGRSRVLIVNKDLIKESDYPTSLADIVKPKFKGKIALCTPYVGTTATHFAALHHKYGEQKFKDFLIGLKNNDVVMLAGNSVVKDTVGNGKFAIGLVDTDDALVGIEQGLPIEMIYYDQDNDGMFSFFQTLSLVKGGKNQANGKILIDYLLRSNIEQQLIEMKAVQIHLLNMETTGNTPKIWTASPSAIISSLPASTTLLRRYLD